MNTCKNIETTAKKLKDQNDLKVKFTIILEAAAKGHMHSRRL